MLKPNDIILFIGDSITHAHRRPEELHDCYSLGCGYVKMIAARLNHDRPELRLVYFNRGECGHHVGDLAQRWERDCLSHRPTVISILIGINDSNPHVPHARQPEQYRAMYARLLERARAALPQTRLVLMEPFGLSVPPPPSPAERASEAQLRNLRGFQPVVRELAKTHGAAFVSLQKPFLDACSRAPAEHWALDGVHPSAAGHELIARAWVREVLEQPHDV